MTRASRFRFVGLVAAVVVVAGTLVGCAGGVEPKVDLTGKRVVVLPFRSQTEAHFGSREGIALARAVTSDIRGHAAEVGYEVIGQQALVEAVDVAPADVELDEVARDVGADAYLTGHLDAFDTMRPGDVGVYRGRARATVWVVDLTLPPDEPEEVLRESIQAVFPPGRFDDPLLEVNADPRTVRDGLMTLLAHRIGRLIYPYDEEEDEGMSPRGPY